MVSKRFFNFVSNDFSDPNNFTPAGSPQPGDIVYIVKARAQATGPLPTGIQIQVSAFPDKGFYSLLNLRDVTIPTNTSIIDLTSTGTPKGAVQSSLQFDGTIVNNGTITFQGTTQTVLLPGGTPLMNNGTINIDCSSPQLTTTANASLTNNGLIRVVNFNDADQNALFGIAIGGTGTVTVSAYSTLELAAALSSTETLRFVGGNDADTTVLIDQPNLLNANIAGFISGDTLTLNNATAISETYTRTGTNTGSLQLFNGNSTPIATLAFNGNYTAANFTLTQSGTAVQITTNVTDSTTGSINPATVNGVFRFFDTADGTHFFTASITERDTVQVSHPEFVQESNGFGALRAADNATASVYRFFDTTRGTHFFTTSAAERDQTIASRSDLTYEPSATFLEHSSRQSGDVAVYRLFSTADGTHLYTGNASELGNLTTPGTASYRPDLIAEGISFYAPAGSYT